MAMRMVCSQYSRRRQQRPRLGLDASLAKKQAVPERKHVGPAVTALGSKRPPVEGAGEATDVPPPL
jgi:hypothetical protein